MIVGSVAKEIDVSFHKGELKFISEIENSNFDKLVIKTVKLIQKNSEAERLINEVLEKGPLTIKLHGEIREPCAQWNIHSRTVDIFVSVEKTKNLSFMLYLILFELSNAVNPFFIKDSEESELVRVSAHPTPESYARMMELAEFSTVKRVQDIYDYAKKNKLWNRKIKYHNVKTQHFEESWKRTNQSGHTDYYRSDFTYVRKTLYGVEQQADLKEKNPGSSSETAEHKTKKNKKS